ncbi:DUF4221 domain-containing protein [Algoriphagus sp. AGSA1]|uniref:DUF4221 family protein n=1 Tax=Algoriphagus sp. AGSA1 TaxID=2907213 RepID=UPI001F258CB8|nr:DUF4221 family protein [Algoriphagus sp. AGSA1]MCE7055930.1 DUF4221 domain-containing protein [Algoriphagus sp. AGSA1]
MRKLFAISFLAFLSACGGKEPVSSEKKNILQNLTYSVDTVVVDAGSGLIDLRYGILKSDISSDQKFLYRLQPSSAVFTVIDLDQLKLVSQQTLAKEGPNAVPNMPQTLKVLNEQEMFLHGFETTGVYSLEGEKLKDLRISMDGYQNTDRISKYSISYALTPSFENQKLYSLPINDSSKVTSFAVSSLVDLKGKVISLPEFEPLSKFSLTYKEGNSYSGANAGSIVLYVEDGRTIIHSYATNSLYIYLPETDSLIYRSYQVELAPNSKKIPVTNDFTSLDDFRRVAKETSEDISYGKIFKDGKSNQYYRFGSIVKPKSSEEEETKNDVYLFAFDQDLNLIGEKSLSSLNSQPYDAFFKDGKLYSYVNVEDELGFAVFTFDF